MSPDFFQIGHVQSKFKPYVITNGTVIMFHQTIFHVVTTTGAPYPSLVFTIVTFLFENFDVDAQVMVFQN